MSRVIFCGNLPLDTRQREVEDLFRKYGCARALPCAQSPVRELT
jgi:hypothetical protein